MDFEKLSLFLKRLSLLKTVIENKGVVVLAPSDKGIDVSYSEDGDVVFTGFYDGNTFNILRDTSLSKDSVYPCGSSFSFSFLLASLLGAKEAEDVVSVFVGGDSLGSPLILLENMLTASGVDFENSNDSLLLYGDVLIGYDTKEGAYYLSLGGQKNVYDNTVLGASVFFSGLADFYPELRDTLPDTDSPLLAGSLPEVEGDNPLEDEPLDFDADMEPEADFGDISAEPEPVQERKRYKAFSAYNKQDDGILFEVFSLLIPLVEYVREDEGGVYFVFKGEESASFVKPMDDGSLCFRISDKEKTFKIDTLTAEADLLQWLRSSLLMVSKKSVKN